jgi:hypothetical protein
VFYPSIRIRIYVSSRKQRQSRSAFNVFEGRSVPAWREPDRISLGSAGEDRFCGERAGLGAGKSRDSSSANVVRTMG